MIFSDFKTPTEVFRAFHLSGRSAEFVEPVAHTASPALRDRIDLIRKFGDTSTEFGIAEGFIYPVIVEVWSYYLDELKPWSHPSFGTDELKGSPDYVVTRIAIRGQLNFEPPYAVIVEAKKENFDEGWGQCLAAMVAAHQLNNRPELALWGAVTTGHLWQFGKLEGNTFTRDSQPFGLTDLDRLCGALRYVFEQVKQYPLPTSEVTVGAV